MKKIVLTPRTYATRGMDVVEKLKSQGFEVIYNTGSSRYDYEELLTLCKDAEGMVTGNDKIDEQLIKQCKHLTVISKYGVGVDNIDSKAAAENNITVKKALGANSVSVAEHTLLMMLSSSKNYVALANHAKNDIEFKYIGNELYGKKLGILGYGAIGKHVAELAKVFGMQISIYDPYISTISDRDIAVCDFDQIIAQSDIISLHMPLTEQTRSLIDKSVISKMQKHVILINSARPELIEESALYEALKNNDILCANEDVEGSSRKTKIKQLNNYTITPHAASFTAEADRKLMIYAVDNVIEELK